MMKNDNNELVKSFHVKKCVFSLNLENGEMFLIESGRGFYPLEAACVEAVAPECLSRFS